MVKWPETKQIPLLLGLGLDEFSMSATSILKARRQINGLSKNEMAELANRAIECATQEEVMELVNNKSTLTTRE